MPRHIREKEFQNDPHDQHRGADSRAGSLEQLCAEECPEALTAKVASEELSLTGTSGFISAMIKAGDPAGAERACAPSCPRPGGDGSSRPPC